MASTRSPAVLMLCLWIHSSIYLQGSNSENPSLWGKKLKFMGQECLWRLAPEVEVPALQELSVCVLLRLTHRTQWTGFDYKAPGGSGMELGLEGTSKRIEALLFGGKWPVDKALTLNNWHSVCLTWSGPAQRLRLYVNGTGHLDVPVNSTEPRRLAPNGTLTLGVSHYVDGSGNLQLVNGKGLLGEVGRFGMWAREWPAEELERQGCVEGDVVRWDLRCWKLHNSPSLSCLPRPDDTLRCVWSSYKIKMLAYIGYTNKSVKPISPLETITSDWMESIFPYYIAVQNITVSSQVCHVGHYPAPLYLQHPQELRGLNITFDECFFSEVFVSVSPADSVELVQAYITKQLSSKFSYNSLTLMTDINRLSIQPVEPFHSVTKPTAIIDREPPGTDPTHNLTAIITETTKDTITTKRFPASPTNISTTEVILDINDTISPDTFFRVNLTLAFIGNPTNPRDVIERWLKDCLEINNTMDILNLRITGSENMNMEQFKRQKISSGLNQEYECAFHVQAYLLWSVEALKNLITNSLDQVYRNDSIVIQTTRVGVKHIEPQNCPEDATRTIYGLFIWPETFPQVKQMMGCTQPPSEYAYRLCKLDIDPDVTSWEDPEMTACKAVITIADLDNITVTADNAADVAQTIQDLVDAELGGGGDVGEGDMSASDLVTVVEKLREVVDVGTVTHTLCANIVHMISDMLISKSDMNSVANMVMNLTERIGDKTEFTEESLNIVTPAMALCMINVKPGDFSGLTFSVAPFSAGAIPEIFLNQSFANESLQGNVATITLPSSLQNLLPGDGNQTRIQFQFYGIQDLFNDPLPEIETQRNWTLGSCIISASINDRPVKNLKGERVAVTLSHEKAQQGSDTVRCVFWDFRENNGQGGWNIHGCETHVLSPNQTSCYCDHLTNFAVLLDVSRTPVSKEDGRILTVISYLGCGISFIFLGITLLTYLAFEKLRRDYPSKILINLSAALLWLNLVFLLNSWLASFSSYSLCILTAAALHYALLAAFMWMALEALHMYFALVKVFNVYVPSYILKFCALGWGLPLAIVSLVLAIDIDAYGDSRSVEMLQTSDPFCWIRSDIFFYVTVVAIVLLILLCNISVFIVVLIQIRRMRTNKPSGKIDSSMHDLRAAASLTVLLGLTWPIAFFAMGPIRMVFLYLFCILNSLQGMFIFLFHCLMKENVRKQWRMHLSFGPFRLNDSSEWSRSVVTVSGGPKQSQRAHTKSMASVDTSAVRKVSDSSSESGSFHHQGESRATH